MIDTFVETPREQVVYHEEDQAWYKVGDEPWRVVFLERGQKVMPKPKAKAYSYGEAFLALFGRPMPIPPSVRGQRREELA